MLVGEGAELEEDVGGEGVRVLDRGVVDLGDVDVVEDWKVDVLAPFYSSALET